MSPLFHFMNKEIDFSDPKWHFEERVQRMMKKGNTREEAEEIVKDVIETKEQ